MTLWFVLALMTGAAMVAVVWPLIRKDRAVRSGSDVAVYRDQLDEIRRDHAAGRIGDNEAEAAQVEVSRRLLAAADAEAAELRAAPTATTGSRRYAVAIASLAVVSFGAAFFYLSQGSPSMPSQPLESRAPGQSIDALIAQVEDHLARNPDDGRGWEVIAPIYLRMGRIDDAVKALQNAIRFNGETADRQAALGEALAASRDGTLSPEAKKAFERAVELDAGNIRARYFLGVAAEQEGRPAAAVEIWRALLAGAPADATWAQFVRQQIARLTGGAGPSDGELAASSDLGPEQRAVMIRGMVARLAERLERDGSDIEGWLQLVRSYMVLGDRDKASAAAGSARRTFASDPDKLRRIDELVKGLGLDG